MNRTETGILLTYIGELDGRQITRETVTAWHDVIGDIPLDDARRAVVEHFKASTDYLKPGHIRASAKDLRKRRLAEIGSVIDPNRADSDDVKTEIETRKQLTEAIASGTLTAADYRAYHREGRPFTEWASRGRLAS